MPSMLPPLIYSLPHQCPIPWPLHPTYAIVDPAKPPIELEQAYLEALYPTESTDHESRLLAFARQCLSLLKNSVSSRDELEEQIRSIILPLHDFDRKWRNTIPTLVKPTSTDNDLASSSSAPAVAPVSSKKDKLGEQEKLLMMEAHRSWRKEQEAKIEADKPKRQPEASGYVPIDESAYQMTEQDNSANEETQFGTIHPEHEEEVVHKPKAWTTKNINPQDWITSCELLDTRLHCLLLFTLISLPDPLNSPNMKPKKKKDPERHAVSLDPELLLDFLTDRLQIWRVMKDVNDLGLGSDTQATTDRKKEGTKIAEDRDEVQQWWLDIVEGQFSSHSSAELLSHHRAKLFPSATPTDALSQRIVPAPSPFKPRTLWSLDKSARRKEKGERALVSESPTMKRLLGVDKYGSNAQSKDMFKVPSIPSLKRKTVDLDATTEVLSSATDREELQTGPMRAKPPRKQERPRPLSRDGFVGSSKGLFNRREVSFGKRTTGLGVKKVASSEKIETAEKGRTSKRKSVSPKKSDASSTTKSFTLVPDTPASSRTSRSYGVAAPALPSFASLGAAFRPGSSAVPDFLPPGLSASAKLNWESDDDDEENERYLRGFERDHGKSGRAMDIGGTPEQARKSWAVPDT